MHASMGKHPVPGMPGVVGSFGLVLVLTALPSSPEESVAAFHSVGLFLVINRYRPNASRVDSRRETGEGSTDWEIPGAGARHHDNHRVPLRSIGVVGTARRKGDSASVGEARDGRGAASANAALQGREGPLRLASL